MSRVKNENNGTIWCILSVPKYAIINLKINNFKQQLEQSDSDKGPRIMPCSDRKGVSILATILIIVHPTKPTFRHEQ